MVGLTELSKTVAKKTGVKQKEAKAVIKALLEEIYNNVKKGKRVSIPRFGIFEKRVQKARKGINPRTKERIKIPKKSKIVFRASSVIKYR